MQKSLLIDGIIIPPTHLELIVADHCNITCRNCNHASPVMTRWFADPDIVYRDFSILAKHYRPRLVKVLGGEPLMHKDLDVVITAARASGISDNFVLITKGTLLDKASDSVWEAVDEVEVSLYPGQYRTEENLKIARAKAMAFSKKLTLNRYEQFRATISIKGIADTALIEKIYRTCKIANLWGCHAVKDGYFYKCPQSIYIPRLTGNLVQSEKLPIAESGSFQERLLEFINSPWPLSACANCVGTVGIQEDHELLPRTHWHTHIDKPLEELIDFDHLERSMTIIDELDDCKIPTRTRSSNPWAKQPWLQTLLSLLRKPATIDPPKRGVRRSR